MEKKIFNSAGEFLESVEDRRDSVWLVEIVLKKSNNLKKTDLSCGKSKFLRDSTRKKLGIDLSRFGILTGVFNCERDPIFCSIKNWSRPQLLLAISKSASSSQNKKYNKDTVEFFYYTNCKNNNYENVKSWMTQILNNRLNDKKYQTNAPNKIDEKFNQKIFFKVIH